MNVRSAAPERAGERSGSVTANAVRHRARAEALGGLDVRGVQPGEARAREEIEVDVHRVGVHEEDGRGAREPPRRALEPQDRLDGARRETALAVEKEKRDDADERRERHGQRDQDAQGPPARKLGALEEEGEGHSDRGRQDHGHERDPQARPERLPLGRPPGEVGEMGEREAGRAEGFEKRQEERIPDEPEEEDRQGGREQRPAARGPHAVSDRGNTRGTGPPGAGTTSTRSPSRAASGGARTSISPAASVTTRKYATRPA